MNTDIIQDFNSLTDEYMKRKQNADSWYAVNLRLLILKHNRQDLKQKLPVIPISSIQFLIESICEILQIPLSDITGSSRERALVDKRAILCFVLRKSLGLALKDIARRVNRDHTSIINLMNKTDTWLKYPKNHPDQMKLLNHVNKKIDEMINTEDDNEYDQTGKLPI